MHIFGCAAEYHHTTAPLQCTLENEKYKKKQRKNEFVDAPKKSS
jgi:hypothetical protein